MADRPFGNDRAPPLCFNGTGEQGRPVVLKTFSRSRGARVLHRRFPEGHAGSQRRLLSPTLSPQLATSFSDRPANDIPTVPRARANVSQVTTEWRTWLP